MVRRRKENDTEPEWFKDIPPSVREKVKREQEEYKPAISIDVFRSLMIEVLAERQVSREKRKRAKERKVRHECAST